MNDETSNVVIDENELIAQRKAKLATLRELGAAYPNGFEPTAFAKDLTDLYDATSKEALQETLYHYTLAGRMMTRRMMGKASFINLKDMTGQFQIYVRQEDVSPEVYEHFKQWDIGDILGVSGYVFKTKTGELSLHATNISLLSKSLRPLPDKFHGLADQEMCYRQRYLDLMMNEETRKTFLIRAQIIDGIRRFLIERRFLEVETPMMHVIPGGAAARPFITKHNALDMDLYLRIAPELYLKRLVVGGFERVFEINRNFRNEGVSTRHNPEFTMIEFYQAYAVYTDLMDLTESLLKTLAKTILGTTKITYQQYEFDVEKPFERLTMCEAILKFNPEIREEELNSLERIGELAKRLEISPKPTDGLGKIQTEIFEKTVEKNLIQPTFITQYPAEVSPLARCNDDNPFVTDRFEFFMAGREIANGFSELNDPEDQAQRFLKQVKEKEAGDLEAMHYDADYVRALEYGMPPTAGEGIGIDRLVMLFTNAASIRDVILFPHMRHKEAD